MAMAIAPRRRSVAPDTLDGFETHVKEALEQCHAPAELGHGSPLAQPFFLGDRCAVGPATPAQRGAALARALRDAAAALDSPADAALLDAYAFEREHVFSKRTHRMQPRVTNTAVALRLNMSERHFYRERDEVVRRLARSLLALIHPALGGERPAEQWMAGRDRQRHWLLEAIRARRSVSLVGNSGSGKTTLAAAVARDLGAADAFWYTLRPGLSDAPGALLIALGHFLRERGAAATWRQLVADQGATHYERVLGTLRFDLATLAELGRAPAFFVDDVDVLQPELLLHRQVERVLEELAAASVTLLIGLRQTILTAERLELSGFTIDEFDRWIEGAGLRDLAPDMLARMYELSRGNPGLLALCRALHQSGGDLSAALASGDSLPSADVIFDRVCRRLGAGAQALLFVLAVCHSPLPPEALSADTEAVEELVHRELVARGEFGALVVSPFIRRIAAIRATQFLPADAHARLAVIYEGYGRAVPCAHHWLEAGRPDMAVWRWFARADDEVNRGHAAAALDVLMRIAPHHLPNQRDRAVLFQARGKLELILGRHEAAAADLSRVGADAPDAIRAKAQALLGTVARAQGRDQEALQHFRAAIETVDGSIARHKIGARFSMGYVLHAREANLDDARRQAALALCDAHVMNADLAAQLGRFDEAKSHYVSALELVEGRPGCALETSQTLSGMGSLLWQMGDVAGAADAITRAIAIDRRRGAVWPEANDLNTLCAVHITAGRHADALTVAEAAMAIAVKLDDAWLLSVLKANMAEAHLALGRLDEAERLIHGSLSHEQVFIRPLTLTLLGTLRARRGRLAEAETALREAIACAVETERPYPEAVALVELASVLQALGRAAEARDNLTAARTRFETMHLAADAAKAERRLRDLPHTD